GYEVEKTHVAHARAAVFPTHDPVDVVVEVLLDDSVKEFHDGLSVSADETGIQELVVRVRLEKLLDLAVGVVLQHPVVPKGAWLTPDIESPRLHLRERVPKHFDVCCVDAPDAAN